MNKRFRFIIWAQALESGSLRSRDGFSGVNRGMPKLFGASSDVVTVTQDV